MLILKVLYIFKINRSFIEALFFFKLCVGSLGKALKAPVFAWKQICFVVLAY